MSAETAVFKILFLISFAGLCRIVPIYIVLYITSSRLESIKSNSPDAKRKENRSYANN